MTDGTKRADIKADLKVSIVLKQDQRTGKLTEGIVRDILTKSVTHPRGIKVRLENGLVGRVKTIHGLPQINSLIERQTWAWEQTVGDVQSTNGFGDIRLYGGQGA